MQVRQSRNSCSSREFTESAAELEGDFTFKLKINEDELGQQEQEGEEEFSFACTNSDGSPVFADEIFQNGKIRPVFPLFNEDLLLAAGESNSDSKNSSNTALRSPVKKLFVKTEPDGPICEWTGKAVRTSPEVCKKSNSTGFSKLRRLTELVLRSNSDGKDAFVFLNNQNPKIEKSEKTTMKEKEEKRKKIGKTMSLSSAHERLYVRNRALKEEHKQKSYLPYRVGFFTNMSGLSRNIHPY